MILKKNLLHLKQDRNLGKVKKFQQKSSKNKQVMRKILCVRCQMTPLVVLVWSHVHFSLHTSTNHLTWTGWYLFIHQSAITIIHTFSQHLRYIAINWKTILVTWTKSENVRLMQRSIGVCILALRPYVLAFAGWSSILVKRNCSMKGKVWPRPC